MSKTVVVKTGNEAAFRKIRCQCGGYAVGDGKTGFKCGKCGKSVKSVKI